MTKTKIAFAAVLFAATSSAAFAQATPASARTLQSAPTHVQQHRNVRLQSAPVLQQRDVALPSEWLKATRPDQSGTAGAARHRAACKRFPEPAFPPSAGSMRGSRPCAGCLRLLLITSAYRFRDRAPDLVIGSLACSP